ncbi:hypothetical protein GFS31_20740 [Leptolyngbya sp. BL0902]|nr:hypothetical protein GFS31_20740 [Leptolyngbya sp. BL0902]
MLIFLNCKGWLPGCCLIIAIYNLANRIVIRPMASPITIKVGHAPTVFTHRAG